MSGPLAVGGRPLPPVGAPARALRYAWQRVWVTGPRTDGITMSGGYPCEATRNYPAPAPDPLGHAAAPILPAYRGGLPGVDPPIHSAHRDPSSGTMGEAS